MTRGRHPAAELPVRLPCRCPPPDRVRHEPRLAGAGRRVPKGHPQSGARSPPGLVLRGARLDVRCDSPQADQRTVKPLESLMPSAAPQMRLLDRSAALRRFRRVSSARSVAVCIPARNEAATIGPIVRSVAGLVDCGAADDLVVVDDGSTDGTTAYRQGGRRPCGCSGDGGPGKGQALRGAVPRRRPTSSCSSMPTS